MFDAPPRRQVALQERMLLRLQLVLFRLRRLLRCCFLLLLLALLLVRLS
jgi:hypothetical protein